VTLTAAVSSAEAGTGTPTGTVTFKDGQVTLGTLPLNGFGQASGTGTLSAGSHSITASYNGDEDFKPSDSLVLTQIVETATPTISWTNPADIDFPTPLGSSQLNATASTEGVFDYLPVAGTVLPPGSHTLAVTFTPTDTGNFNTPSPTSVTINVKPTYTLNTTLAGTGTGTVSGSGISCGTDCSERYPSSTVNVTLKATASQGSVFLGWSGDCIEVGPCTVSMNQNRHVTATFANVSTIGRMTGSGHVSAADGTRVTYDMELNCSLATRQNNLEVVWAGNMLEKGDEPEKDKKAEKGNRFKLDAMTSVLSYDDERIGPQPHKVDFDTIKGTGIGKLNGELATIEWSFFDGGEPRSNDTATIVIRQGSKIVVSVSGKINGSNQAHR
jgi:hypothetical protein